MECDSSSTHSKFSQACVQVKMQSRAEQQQIESKPRKIEEDKGGMEGKGNLSLEVGRRSGREDARGGSRTPPLPRPCIELLLLLRVGEEGRHIREG